MDERLLTQARGLGALLDETVIPATSHGPLDGWQIALKDVFDVAGQITTGGTPSLAANTRPLTSSLVARLLDAGAAIGPRTNLNELSLGITSENHATQPVRNPHDPELVAGGSSGGAAVVVALGLTRAALGADTGGSIRVPASFCGVVGFRPSNGRWPADGVLPLSPTRDTPGSLTRDVADARLLDAVVTSEAPLPPLSLAGVRLGRLTPFVADLDPAVDAAFAHARAVLADAGVTIVDVDPGMLVHEANAAGLRVFMGEMLDAIPGYLASGADPKTYDEVFEAAVTPECRKNLHVARKFADPAALAEARAALLDLRGRVASLLAEAGVVAFCHPTSPVLPTRVGEGDVFATVARNAALAGILGLPAVSLPLPVTGVPIGLELLAAHGDDARLLALADAVANTMAGVAAR